jgi:hypothetical protein
MTGGPFYKRQYRIFYEELLLSMEKRKIKYIKRKEIQRWPTF